MRISDWSSDVCSSDLNRRHDDGLWIRANTINVRNRNSMFFQHLHDRGFTRQFGEGHDVALPIPPNMNGRSEEHTSELQSLMRISYAVFCLKKKIKIL